ncbi:hypothetical protein LPB90_15705 [Chryseobacterium sp. LC2016-29]|uniref:hypothetical protein n=1 Tax=Chryseobacterium sp. LC2016-29 TaxID=2897331 RepID=UPI001E3DD8A5|nr:hypothetical protein [Chryseobacterium sp. LC2016-29]MCD0479906.1 hypothetical protein [Chryseobacterium sp. LC2016-29]
MYNFGSIKIDGNNGSSGNPKYTELKNELLVYNFEMINAEVIKEGGNQTLAVLASIGKNPIL